MFPIAFIYILVLGPFVNEGGFKAVNEKGYKAAIEAAIDEAVPLKASKTGNYGND